MNVTVLYLTVICRIENDFVLTRTQQQQSDDDIENDSNSDGQTNTLHMCVYQRSTGTCAQFNFHKSFFHSKKEKEQTKMEADIMRICAMCVCKFVYVCYSFH